MSDLDALSQVVSLAQRLGVTPEQMRAAAGLVPATLPLGELHPTPRPGMRRTITVHAPTMVMLPIVMVVYDTEDAKTQAAARKAAELKKMASAPDMEFERMPGAKDKGPEGMPSHPLGPGWDRP